MIGNSLRYLDINVDGLQISHCIRNRLREAGIMQVGDLVQKTDKELLYIRSFGKKSLSRIKCELAMRGLELGMSIPDWPEDIAAT